MHKSHNLITNVFVFLFSDNVKRRKMYHYFNKNVHKYSDEYFQEQAENSY